MPRVPSRLQVAPYGTRNPAAHGRTGITPAIQARGPAQPVELFDGVTDSPTRSALQRLQQGIARATSQAKAAPFSRSNILRGLTLTAGGANGATPMMVAHGLEVTPTGAVLLATYGGYVGAPLVILPNPASVSPHIIQLWLQAVTAFAGVAAVTGDVLVYA